MEWIFKNIRIVFFSFLSIAIIVVGYSLVFPKRFSAIDQARLLFESAIIKGACDSLVGKEYVDDRNNPVEGPTDISFKETTSYRNFLEPGDVFFTNTRRYVGSMFVRGKWKHSAIYIGTREKLAATFGEVSQLYSSMEKYFVRGDEDLIIDSSLLGVQVREFSELSNLSHASYLQSVSAFRPKISRKEKELFVKSAFDQVSKKYDYDLLTYNSDSVYCSELLFFAFDTIGINLEIPQKIVNRMILTPSDIVKFLATKGVPANTFAFLFFVEKESYEIVERSFEEIL